MHAMLTTELTHACVTSSITALYFGLLIWVHVTTIYFLWISKSNLNIELNSLSKYLFEKKVMWICEHSLFKKIVETCVNGFFKPYVSVQFEIHVIPRVKCYIQINGYSYGGRIKGWMKKCHHVFKLDTSFLPFNPCPLFSNFLTQCFFWKCLWYFFNGQN